MACSCACVTYPIPDEDEARCDYDGGFGATFVQCPYRGWRCDHECKEESGAEPIDCALGDTEVFG